MALDYGYEITIDTPGTSDPSATPTNQWQRQTLPGSGWQDIPGKTGEKYTVVEDDRGCEIRLVQIFDGTKAYSNQLQVTTDPFDKASNLSEFGSYSGRYKWQHGILAPNGKIYGIPYSSSAVLEVDPETKTSTTFGNLGSVGTKWRGAALAPNGKIYCAPYMATSVLEIDPVNKTTSEFGNFSGEYKWSGAVCAPNGKIYCVPAYHKSVLEIDPDTKTTSLFADLSDWYALYENVKGKLAKWMGAVLAPNGKIYGIPSYHNKILEIDPVRRTATTWGDVGKSSNKWLGGVLGPNSKIYGLPAFHSTCLEIDVNRRTTATIGNLAGGIGKYDGGAIAPDGMIYAFPAGATSFLELDPINRTLSEFGDLPGDFGRATAILAVNGKLYALPYDKEPILELDLGFPEATGSPGSESWSVPGLPGNVLDPRSPYFNNY